MVAFIQSRNLAIY